MARGKHSTMNWLHGISGDRTRKAVLALIQNEHTAYEQTTAAGSATGLNSPNRVRNSTTLVAEPNLVVNVTGNTTYRIQGVLGLALTAANNIKFDFAGGTATIVSGTMGGFVRFTDAASTTIPLVIALTALNTLCDGGTTKTWVLAEFDFTAQFNVGGVVQLEFAQKAASTTNTDILPGSYLRAIPLDHVIS